MGKYVVAGVGTATAYETGSNPKKILSSTTLQEEGMSLSVSAEDVRGGLANQLLARYFHDSLLECTLNDALFDMNYIALNAGGTLAANNTYITSESVTVGTGGTVTVTGTPVTFGDDIYGWVAEEGSSDYQTVTFTNKTATTTLSAGTTACVQYNIQDTGMEYFTIPANIIPSIVHMIMSYPLFASGDTTDISTQTQVGELIIDIPRFQFNGTFDMSLTSSGAATSSLSGQALAKHSTSNCEDMSAYGDIKMKLYDSVWYGNLEAMYIEDAEFSLAVNDTKTLKVYGVYSSGATGYIPNAQLTFTSDNAAATVDNTTDKGKVTGASAGTAHIEVKPTAISGKATPPSVAAYAEVTVTSE